MARSLDANQPLPEKAQQHLRQCLACRQSYELELALTRQLISGAGRHRQAPSPFLHARIMGAVDRQPSSSVFTRRLLQPIAVTAVVIIGLGLLSLSLIRNPPPGRAKTEERLPATTQVALQHLATNVPAAIGPSMLELSKALDRPLEGEMQCVVSDAKAAMQLLAGNFLPEPN